MEKEEAKIRKTDMGRKRHHMYHHTAKYSSILSYEEENGQLYTWKKLRENLVGERV